MDQKKYPSSLQETRLQGSVTFPCTMYTADSSALERTVPFYTKLHWHDAVEILYFRRGTFQLTVNTRQMEICQETICFIESGSLHAIYSERDYREYALLFDPFFLAASHPDEAGKMLIDPLLQGTLRLPLILDRSNTAFEEIREEFVRLQKIFSETGKAHSDQKILQTPASQLRVRACILNMLAALSENDLLNISRQHADPRIDALKKVMLYIQKHYSEKIYLRDLAQIMNMNEQYFCRFFRKTTGKTPVSYINEIRIRHAALMLTRQQDHSVSVADVASECGFGNMGHFITEFRNITRTTPLDYRRTWSEKDPADRKE